MISEIHDGDTHELLRRAGFFRGCRFVEFGCGMGYVTRWAASEGAQAVGLDANKEQIRASHELATKRVSPTPIFGARIFTSQAWNREAWYRILLLVDGSSESAGGSHAGDLWRA
jgi:hypothetical protein